ncbi:PREDICTED: histone-lysine N-methyltransferase SETMAR-like [Habropoda laboriosa]|uniref:histone-lysine N-methyltransferase SETMAR-like n=1 Tax=Habropoda laboriosa TaxID=597456 RepID=UPI00083E270F|nr:PREDICTED: histone-lysine N-methyltransferase SETMAR-like [Habropoda laboriosa]
MDIKVIQINLNNSRIALDSLKQMMLENGTDVAIICEPPRNITGGMWFMSQDGKAAILVKNPKIAVDKEEMRESIRREGKLSSEEAEQLEIVRTITEPWQEKTAMIKLPKKWVDKLCDNEKIKILGCPEREMLNISKSTIHKHFVKLGYVNRFDVWVPHDLTEKNLMDRISICDSVYKRNEETPFLKQLVTGDEKWIIYNNVQRKRSWGKRNEPPLVTPKAGLHPKKVMLCVWWDWKGILYYYLLANNETINSEKYCSQLEELRVAIEQKRLEMANRKGVMFHQDNARPHVSLTTRQKLLELGWDVDGHNAECIDVGGVAGMATAQENAEYK